VRPIVSAAVESLLDHPVYVSIPIFF